MVSFISIAVVAVIFLILVLILFKISKTIAKIIVAFVLLLIILTSLFSYLLYADLSDLNNNLYEKPSIFIIKEETNTLSIVSLNLGMKNDVIQELSNQEYYSIRQNFENDNLDVIINNYFKLIIVDITVLEKTPKKSIKQDKLEITKETAVKAIKSDNPLEMLNLDVKNLGNNQLKTLILLKFLGDEQQETIEDSILPLILGEYKEGNILIYKDTIIFKLTKILPKSLITARLKKSL